MPEQKAPAGWYDYDGGEQRFWDGERWTEERRASPVTSPAAEEDAMEGQTESVVKSTPQSAMPPPGWYEDPDGSGQRWWDGTQWTAHRKATQGGVPIEVSRGLYALTGQPKGFYWAALGVLAIVAGSLGPWARAVFVTVNGTEGDGKYFLVGCIFIVASLWGYARSGSKGGLIFPVIAGLFIGGDSISILNRINDASHTTLFGKEITVATPEWGIYATMIGGGVLVIASLVLAFSRREEAETTPVKQHPAGWYPDPNHESMLRYWDGTRWTEHRHGWGTRPTPPG
jgi:hypothetical protein